MADLAAYACELNPRGLSTNVSVPLYTASRFLARMDPENSAARRVTAQALAKDPSAVLNGLSEGVRFGGGTGIRDIYTAGDSQARNEMEKQGRYPLDFGKAWIKSPSVTAGQCPVVKYSRDLMQAILWGRLDHLVDVMNAQVVSLENALEAYKLFDHGSAKKYVVDPHNVTGKITPLAAAAAR